MPQPRGWVRHVRDVLFLVLGSVISAVVSHAWPVSSPVADSRPQPAPVIVIVIEHGKTDQHQHRKPAPHRLSKHH